jgi:rhodanese-related sulfurtransferase
MGKITPDELDARLDGDAPFVLDVRPRGAFRAGHIEGSHNVPVYDALRGGDEDALRSRLDEIPRDRAVVTVCKQGVVARRATRILDAEGYDATTLAGGMGGWRGYQNGTLGYRLRSLLWRLG